jgi:prephenate dehydratase
VPRFGFLGPRATFTEQALRTMPESVGAELVPCTSSGAVLAAVRDGSIDAGCVPFENSVEGSVAAVLDGLVDDPPLVITREVVLPVWFSVMVRPGTTAADVRTVASHPHGEAQTRGWLAANLPHADVLLASSTSEAAAQVARGEVDAAVAAPLAAELHGLAVLAEDVGDTADAVTRFVLLRHPGPPPAPTGTDRTSLVATTENRPGALLAVLSELSVRDVDLTRIESRPSKERLGVYWFHLDCTGHVAAAAMGEAMAALHRRCTRVRYLGSYPRATGLPDGAGTAAEPIVAGVAGAEHYEAAAAWLAEVRAGNTA